MANTKDEVPDRSRHELSAEAGSTDDGREPLGSTESYELAPAQELPEIKIAGYRLIRELSRGGQAVVYLAQRDSWQQEVAVKVLHEGPFASPAQQMRFEREVKILKAIDHPGVVPVLDHGATGGGSFFLTMPYIQGRTLHEFIRSYRRQHPPAGISDNPRELLDLFLKICEAVNAAHLCGVVHRDLKPSNIMVDASGSPFILDFGLARPPVAFSSDDRPVTVSGQFLGSVPWASPEQAEGKPDLIDTRTDVYALGVVLYQMLTGAFPYKVTGSPLDALHSIRYTPPVPPRNVIARRLARCEVDAASRRRFVKAVDARLEAIVLMSLKKAREERYQTAGEFARDISNYLAKKPTIAGGAAAPRTWPRAVVGLAGIMVILLAGTWAVSKIPWDDVRRLPGVSQSETGPSDTPSPISFAPMQRANQQVASRTNLKAIAIAMALYATSFRDRYPPSLDPVVRHGYLGDPLALISPLDGVQRPEGFYAWPQDKQVDWALARCSYVVLRFNQRMSGDYSTVLAFEKFAPHKQGTAVAMDDAHVHWMSLDEARQLIEKQTGKTVEELTAAAKFPPEPE